MIMRNRLCRSILYVLQRLKKKREKANRLQRLRMINMTKIQKVEDPSLPFEVIKTQTCPLSATGDVGKVVAKRIEVKLCNCLALYNSLSLCDLGDLTVW